MIKTNIDMFLSMKFKLVKLNISNKILLVYGQLNAREHKKFTSSIVVRNVYFTLALTDFILYK